MVQKLDLGQPENVQFQQLTMGIREYNDEMIAMSGSPGIMISKLRSLCMPDGWGGLTDCTEDSLAVLIRMTVEPGKWKTTRDKDTGLEETQWFPDAVIPRKLVKSYMDAKLWMGIPSIKAVARSPMIRKDFTTRWDPGYDSVTEAWVTEGIKEDRFFIDYPGFKVETIFDQFPFMDRRLVADALAAALTPLLATAIEGGLPALIVSARKPGSGKSELAKACSIMGNGGMTFTTWRGNTEFDKTVHSYVSEDTPVVIFDNVKNKIDSQSMESVITSRRVSTRKFYSQTTVNARSNTVWFFTANGASVSDDMMRRSILIALDKEATPSLKPWTGDVPPYIEAREAALVTYMCNMIEQWRLGGRVMGSLGNISFPEWAGVVSGILEHAGITGLFEAREKMEDEAVQTDEDDEVAVVDAIAAIMGPDEWLASDLWETVNDGMSGLSNPKCLFVKKWLDSAGVGSKDKPTLALGMTLRAVLEKRFDSSDVYLTARKGTANKRYYKCTTKSGAVIPAASVGFTGSF